MALSCPSAFCIWMSPTPDSIYLFLRFAFQRSLFGDSSLAESSLTESPLVESPFTPIQIRHMNIHFVKIPPSGGTLEESTQSECSCDMGEGHSLPRKLAIPKSPHLDSLPLDPNSYIFHPCSSFPTSTSSHPPVLFDKPLLSRVSLCTRNAT